MNVTILEEHGYESALLGLSLSHNQEPSRMQRVAQRLCMLGDGHNKFLESIVVWLDIVAPRYFWQQFDTYRIGVSRQSESTMHTIACRPLNPSDFEHPIPASYLTHLNERIAAGDWEGAKRDLPESFRQRRIVCTNYMSLQRLIRQRADHRLSEWRTFIDGVLVGVQHPELLRGGT